MNMTYRVFVRKWWQEATRPGWPNNLEPCGTGRQRTIRRNVPTEQEARQICAEYNDSHEPGRYSVKAEYKAE